MSFGLPRLAVPGAALAEGPAMTRSLSSSSRSATRAATLTAARTWVSEGALASAPSTPSLSRASSKTSFSAAPPSPSAAAAALRVFEELRRLASGCDAGGAATEVGDLGSKDLEEIRQLKNPPVVVRRTLEAVYLLLNAARAPPRPQPPEWARVQKMLSDAGLVSRMLTFDATILQQSPVLTAYVAMEYFGAGGGASSATMRRSTTNPQLLRNSFSLSKRTLSLDELEPLTFDRVQRASRATAALFRWSALVLVQALDPTPSAAAAERRPSESEPEAVEAEAAPPEPIPAVVVVQAPAAEQAPQPTPAPVPPARPESPRPQLPAAAARPATREARPARVLPPRAAPVSPRPRAVVKENAQPDRHFETLIVFVIGSAKLAEEGDMMLQTIAATYCMRRRLHMRLITCPDQLEHDALARKRVTVAQEWLVEKSIPVGDIMVSKETRRASGEPGVICQFLLDNDTVLRDFYLLVAQGENPKDVGTRDTLNFAAWLAENFQECLH